MRDGLNYDEEEVLDEGASLKRQKFGTQAEPKKDWEPPVNQLGDGMTQLNAKFGY